MPRNAPRRRRTPPPPARRPLATRSRVATFALALTALSMLGIHPALAACSAPDLSCAEETVGGAQDQVVEPVVGPVEGPVEETVEAVEETVGSVLDDAEEIVDEIVGGGPGDEDPAPADPPAPGGGTEPGAQPGPVSPPSANEPAANDGQGGGARPPRDAAPAPETAGPRDPVSNVAAGVALDPAGAAVDRSPPLERSTGFPRLIGTALAFPAILAVAVLLFVAVQNRLDRRDPRLALATMRPEVVRFE